MLMYWGIDMRIEQRWDAHASAIDRFGRFTEMEVNYIIFDIPEDSNPEETALRYAYENVPQQYQGLTLNEIRIEDRAGLDSVYITATYEENSSFSGGKNDRKGQGKGTGPNGEPRNAPTVSFDCSGATINVPYAITQRPCAGSKDVGLAIGWNGKYGSETQITGAEVPFGRIRKTYTREFYLNEITPAVEVAWTAAVGTVNSKNFLGWPEGSAMFTGCSYSGDDLYDSVVKVSFNFEMAAPEKDAVVDGISCGYKEGHEYIWTMSESVISPMTGLPEVQTKGIWIAQVAKKTNFDIFGL